MVSPQKQIVTHTFTDGMIRDTALWRLQPTAYYYGLNIRIFQSGESRIIVNPKGNTEIIFDLPAGDNYCIGSYGDTENNKFYFYNWNENGFHGVYYYDYLLNSVTPILVNKTDTGGIDILFFQKRALILHIDVIKGPNGDSLLYWCDGQVKQKKFNVQKALNKTATGYGTIITATDINAYKLAASAPTTNYFTDTSRDTNFVYGHLYKSSLRQWFDDGEKNNWSEFSTVAIPVSQGFTGNPAISNVNNTLQITVETGPSIVKQLEIALKDGSNDFVSIIVLDKAKLGIPDDSTYTYNFYNDNTSYTALDQADVYRAFSFMPRLAALQAFCHNAMVYGKGIEGFPVVDVLLTSETIYTPLFLPDDTTNDLNDPEFTGELLDYDFTKQGPGRRCNSLIKITVGHDVKAGNIFSLYGRNGGADNVSFFYTATNVDSAITVANAFKQQLVATKRILTSSPELPDTDIWENDIDGGGNVSFEFIWRGEFGRNVTEFTGTVVPVSFQTLKDNGQSVLTQKSGDSVNYAILYWNEDTYRSNAYTSPGGFVRHDFVTQTGGFKKIDDRLSIKNQPPIWATHYEIVRTVGLTYGSLPTDYIQILIQKAIESQSTTDTDYVDLIIGSLYTYQKMYPNTIVRYEFEKNDRVRLIKKESDGTYYDFIETVVLDFKEVGTSVTIDEDVTTNETNVVTIGGVTSSDNIGRYIVIDGIEREIIAVPSGTTYTLAGTYGTSEKYASFQIIDKRGILRIRKPIGITIEDNSLIEVYKPTQNVQTAQKNFYLFGQKYAIQDAGTPQRAHTGNIQNQDYTNPVSSPAIVSITEGTSYVRRQQFPTNNQIPGTQVVIDLKESQSYSDFYESSLNNNGKVAPEDDGSGEIRFGSRLRYSNNYIEGTRINGLNDFDNLDREDYNDPWGDFMLLKYRDRLLYAYKQLRLGYIGVLNSIITSSDGNSSLATTTKFLNQYNTFAWEGGIGNNPESYASDQNWQYVLSANSGADCRIGGDGVLPISQQFGLSQTVRDYIDLAQKYSSFVFGGFDRQNDERILAFENYNEYLYNGSFNETDWELYDEDLPDDTNYEITTQPVNGDDSVPVDAITTYTPDTDFVGSDPSYFRWSLAGGGFSAPKKICMRVDDVPVPAIQTIYYNAAVTVNVQKDDCTDGYHGSFVPITVEEFTFSSPFSQENADQQAADYITVNGQTIANETGTCDLNEPTDFSFVDATDLVPNTLTESNSQILAGTFDTYRYILTDCEISINGVWTSDDGLIDVGDTFKIRRLSAAAYDTTVEASLTIGSETEVWHLTTIAGGTADAAESTLTPTSATIAANGVSTQVLTVQAKDSAGNNLVTGGSTVLITQDSGTGTIGSVTDNSDGTYTATVTSAASAGSGLFSATLDGNDVESGLGSQTVSTITYEAIVSKDIAWSNAQDLSPFVSGSFDYYENGVLQFSERGNGSGTITVNSGTVVKFIQNGQPVLNRWPSDAEDGNSANMSVTNGMTELYNNTVTSQSAALNEYEFTVAADGSYSIDMSTSSSVSGYSTYTADAESTIPDVQVGLTDSSSGNVELLIQDIPLTSEDYLFNVLTGGGTITANFVNHSGATIEATVTGVDTITITDGNSGSIPSVPKGNVEIRIVTV